MKSLLQPFCKLLIPVITLLTAHPSVALTYVWNVGTPGANNWNVSGNWNIAGNPGASDNAVFAITGTSPDAITVNNIVSVNTAITALSYTNNTAGTWHVTQIPTGVTLTTSGTVTVGGGNDPAGNAWTTSVAMTGNGTYVATGNTFTIGNNAASGNIAPGTLDLSGLDNFVYIASGGTISIGTGGSRSMGNISLAAVSNSVTAGTINMQGATGTATGTGTFNLGSGTNRLNVGTFNLGGGRVATILQFPGGSGGWRLRGTGGTDSDRTTMLVGDRNVGGTGTSLKTTTGSMLLNGHPVDLKFSTLTLGRMSRSQSGTDAGFYNGVGVLQFDQGVIDATTINLAVCSGNSTNSLATGTLTMGGGTLVAGNISLVNVSSAAANVGGSGTFSVIGGSATVTGNITKTTSTGSTGTVEVANSSSLAVGGRIGSTANPIDNLNLTDANLTLAVSGTVTNVAVINLTTGGSTNIINISTIPGILGYPAQFPVISYAGTIGGNGFDNNIGLGSLPAASPSYVAYLSNNTATLTIDLVITAGPAPAQPITWSGTQNGAWDTSTLNWLAGATATNYNNAGDFVTFNDSASTSTVHLVTTSLTPGSITVNNSSLTYTFTGTGKISGGVGLTKLGSGRLVLDESGVNDFSGPVSLTGTLQVGNGGTSGTLPAGVNVTNNGTLVFNRSDTLAVPNLITGTGAVVKNAANTLTLSAANKFTGGLVISNGVLRATTVSAPSTGAVTVYSGGIFVAGATQTNTYTLAGGAMGVVSGAMNNVPGELTAAPGTTSTLYLADPQNLGVTDATELAFTNTWHGSGNVTVLSVTNDTSADSGNGLRLRGTAASDFSGTLTLGSMVKGELQTSVAGPFSPAGTGKIVLTCGSYYGTNGTLAPGVGGYSELNLRMNSPGDTTLGNDIELAGSGLALLNPLGTAPTDAIMTMGNLRIGGGQELGVYLSSGNTHIITFPTVTLTGGDVRFSPKTPGFGAIATVGSDISLGNISQTSASTLTMNGLRRLFISGTSTHTGSTTVSNGTLHLSGALNGGGALTVAGGTLMGNGSTAGSVTVNPAGTIAPGASVGQFTATGAVTLLGTNVMEIDRDAGTNDVLQGASIAFGGTLVISNLTSALQAGDFFKLYTGPRSGSFSAIIPAEPSSGLLWDTSSLVSDGILKVVAATVQPYISSVVLSGSNLVMSGTNGPANGSYFVLTSTNVALPVVSWDLQGIHAFDNGSFSFTNAVNPSEGRRFFLIQLQ